MFENVDGRTDGRRTDAGVTGILIAHLGAFGSGELIIKLGNKAYSQFYTQNYVHMDIYISVSKIER